MSMHIALTFDDNFWAPAFATMRSVCLFTPQREELVFHLCHRTLTPEHKADLEAIRDEFPVTLVWHALDQMDMFTDIAARMPESKRFPSIVYARLLIDRLVGDGVDRVLYLDCDTMVRDDVKRLFDQDLEAMPSLRCATSRGRISPVAGTCAKTAISSILLTTISIPGSC